jgi:hypothetical protein
MCCSICTVCKGRTSFRLGGVDNGTQGKRSLAERQRLSGHGPAQNSATKEVVHEPAETRPNETILLLLLYQLYNSL